jgi:flagellar basal-body rod protein FlgC
MTSGVHAALSGLLAYSTRVANNANNVANMNTGRFKKDRVVLSTQEPQGVRATVDKVKTPGPAVAEMTDQGYEMAEQSTVDLGEEIPELIVNQNSYGANLKFIKSADQMMQSLLDLKA